ncbi:MAG: DUF2852 domain-containing protein [Thiolinea sp.]
MSPSSSSAVESSSGRPWKNWEPATEQNGKKSHWSCMNITGMVLGFILFWPVGLVVLFWILSGRHVQELPAAIKRKWSETFGGARSGTVQEANDSDNSVFNAFQQTQYDRISEIKEEIRERARRFADYRADAKRRADEEEFNQFMANSPNSDNK